jgi:hypothetical protein
MTPTSRVYGIISVLVIIIYFLCDKIQKHQTESKIYWFCNKESKNYKESKDTWLMVKKKLKGNYIKKEIDISDPQNVKICKNFNVTNTPKLIKLDCDGNRFIYTDKFELKKILEWLYN